jgi:hypothetical protein
MSDLPASNSATSNPATASLAMASFTKPIFWRRYWFSLLRAAIALLALGFALVAHNHTQTALLAAKNSYQQQLAINLEAEQAALVLAEYLPPYQTLQTQGFIGQPPRLQWLEALRTEVAEQAVPALHFNLSASTLASDTNTTYKHETLALKVTPMQFDFTLLHEGDLAQLLNRLQIHAKGIFSTERCDITRSDADAVSVIPVANRRLSANFKGQCELLWYSLADITLAWESVHAP